MRFRAIGFDYHGVIFGPPGHIASRGIAEILGVSFEKYQESHFRHNVLVNVHRMPFEEVLRITMKDLGVDEKKLSEVLRYREKEWKSRVVNRAMLTLLDRLRALNYKLGLLSNMSFEGALEIRKSGLNRHFDVMMFSSEIGHQKPSKEAFTLFSKELGVEPRELIFIGRVQNTLRSLPQG